MYGQTFTFSGLTGYTALNGHCFNGAPKCNQIPPFRRSQSGYLFFWFRCLPKYCGYRDSNRSLCNRCRNCTGCYRPLTENVLIFQNSLSWTTNFQSVGNELFFSVGPSNKKLITPNLIWAPNQTFNTGNQILDPNGNLQIVQGTGTATITEIAVVGSTLGVVGGPTIYFSNHLFVRGILDRIPLLVSPGLQAIHP